jgi:outer membrane protein TolC
LEPYVGSVGAPIITATQADLARTKADLARTKADLASTKAELAKIKTDLANTKTDLSSYFAKFPKFIKIHLPGSPWSKEKK